MKLKDIRWIVLAFPLLFPTRSFATWIIDQNGKLTNTSGGMVLGKNDSESNHAESSGGEGSSAGGNTSSGGSTSNESGKSESNTTQSETSTPTTSNGRTETRSEGIGTAPQSAVQKSKVNLEFQDDKALIQLENESTNETEDLPGLDELEQDEPLLKIEDRTPETEIEVSSNKKQFIINRNNVKTTTAFPLSIDLSTNKLTVTTANGTKEVTVLPDKAIENILANGVFDKVTSINQTSSTLVQLPDGQIAYQVAGTKQKKLLGILPVTINKTTTVSAQTGATIKTSAVGTDQILEFFSF